MWGMVSSNGIERLILTVCPSTIPLSHHLRLR
jgi:hypothetical protein